MVSPLQNAVTFFKEFGLFDVVLPFLLVFTIIFAILEKTRILGTEKDPKDKDISRKNLNGVVSFVIAMTVVATNKIVMAINTALPNVVFLVIVCVSFLILISVFFGTGELNFSENDKTKTYAKIFMIVLLILIIVIFLNSLTLNSGESWLEYGASYALDNISGPVVTSLIFLVVALGAIFFVVSSKGGKKE